jgi:predicted ester cyclase
MADAAVADQNETVVRRVFDDVINGRDLAAANEICTDDAVIHVPGLELPHGPEALKAFAQSLHDGFADLRVVIDDVVAADKAVAVRWHTERQTQTGPYRGIPPTGRAVAITGNNVYRLEDGKVREAWIEVDSLGLAQQLGVVPGDGLGSGARVRFILGSIVRLGYLQAKYSIGARRRGSKRS